VDAQVELYFSVHGHDLTVRYGCFLLETHQGIGGRKVWWFGRGWYPSEPGRETFLERMCEDVAKHGLRSYAPELILTSRCGI
jgi:hypothetical protein